MPPPGKINLVSDREGERLDQFVARSVAGLSRSHVQRLIADGHVRVDGIGVRPSFRLGARTVVEVDIPTPQPSSVEPEEIAIQIVYEDADLIAVNKPAGMAVHPSPGHARSTLVNAVLAHCDDLSGVGGVTRPGIVHRLDKDTSGIILIAKNDEAHRGLANALKDRSVEKLYVALVDGVPSPAEGVIDAPIARDPRNRQRMGIVAGGREAVTAYRITERFDGASLLDVRPRTGRTHQIRVHLAAIGHPIVGDAVYGRRSPLLARQFLHALRIDFDHPRTGQRLTLEAALADDLQRALTALRGH